MTQEIRTLSFVFEPLPYDDSELTAVPTVDGTRLVELVAQYEREHGCHMPGAYGGVDRCDFTGDPLGHYLLETSAGSQVSGRRWLLGCTCGVAECWPLKATIARDERHIIWSEFAQPHRPRQDYSGFGPFVFDVEQYRQAVVELAMHKTKRVGDGANGFIFIPE